MTPLVRLYEFSDLFSHKKYLMTKKCHFEQFNDHLSHSLFLLQMQDILFDVRNLGLSFGCNDQESVTFKIALAKHAFQHIKPEKLFHMPQIENVKKLSECTARILDLLQAPASCMVSKDINKIDVDTKIITCKNTNKFCHTLKIVPKSSTQVQIKPPSLCAPAPYSQTCKSTSPQSMGTQFHCFVPENAAQLH